MSRPILAALSPAAGCDCADRASAARRPASRSAPAPSSTCYSMATPSPARRSCSRSRTTPARPSVTKRIAEKLIGNDHAKALMGLRVDAARARHGAGGHRSEGSRGRARPHGHVTEKLPISRSRRFRRRFPQASTPSGRVGSRRMGSRRSSPSSPTTAPESNAEKWFSDTFEKDGGTITQKISVPARRNPHFAPFLATGERTTRPMRCLCSCRPARARSS